MNLRTLGSTRLLVSPIGLGLAALGRPGYINLGHAEDLERNYDVEVMRQHAHQVLDAAWEAGVRYFDAARSYGLAEDFLGTWLRSRHIPIGAVTVGSKWGYTYTAGWRVQAEAHEVKEHSLPVLQRQMVESRANLGPYLRLYQIHSATIESGVLDNRPVLDELARLKRDGLAIGLSVSGPQQVEIIRRALDLTVDRVRLFDAVQVTWNVLEPSTGSTLQEAHVAGIGVIVKEVLANGRLTRRNTAPAFAGKRTRLQWQADRLHTSLETLALAAVLAQPWVNVVLSGAATVEQIRSNVQALQVPWDAEAANEIAALAEPTRDYWQARAQLEWQ